MSSEVRRPFPEAEFVRVVDALAARRDTTGLVELLGEQHPIYEEQRAQTIVRMRGWILVVLSRGKLPAAALPFVLEELETSLDAYLVAAAAMALRGWPQPSSEFAPFLLRALDNVRGRDQPLAFTRYGEYADSAEASCAVHELLLTAAWLGRRGEALAPRLLAWDETGGLPSRLREDLQAARRAIETDPDPETATEECCPSIIDFAWSSWRPSERRRPDAIEDVVFEDQSGATVRYSEFFVGGPTIAAFFYTRCDNPLKCSLTIWKLAQAQKQLESRGLADRIRTAAITYDPGFDCADRLRVFGRNRGLRMDAQHRLLRAVDGIGPLRSHFGLGVSFAGGLVNRHRVEICLLDRHGRIAWAFQRLHWKPEQVVAGAADLLREPDVSASAKTAEHSMSSAGPLGAIIVACLPKCPICWSAYLSSAGLTAVAGSAYTWTYQLVALLLALHLASVFWRACATQRWLGFSLSLAGSALLLASSWWHPAIQPVATVMIGAGALVSALERRPSSWFARLAPSRFLSPRQQST